MRPIDADALTKEFDDKCAYECAICKYSKDFAPCKLIDNAPTVERPQGEWIIVKDEKWGDNVKCPFCEKELAGTDLNFCCKCGAKLIGSEKMNDEADMRGGRR